MEHDFRLIELLGALSLTTDLGAGVPFEKGLRTSAVALWLADALELPLSDRRAAYFAALLRSLGCTAHASVFAEMFGDDVAIQRELKLLDLTDPELAAAQVARFSKWAGAARAQELVQRFGREVPAQGTQLGRGACEVSAALGARLGLPDGAIAALDEVYERFDGNGFPEGRAGEQLTIAARVVHVAEQAVVAHYEAGAEVSSSVWDRPGPLGPVEWERVRLHSYWTERILARCPALARLAPLAGAHHERLDGSGYHRGARGIELSSGARMLAAADAFAAMTEARPYRDAFSREGAAAELHQEVLAGRLDAEAAGAVIEAAGLPRRRTAWPNDLTDREVEVLRVLARGLSNREIAETLVLSPRTVQHHLASVYDKISMRTRAGAAVFAIENGLVPAMPGPN